MSAQPLGIGDIQMHSALNEKLDAEIHLRLNAGENPGDISVRLASPEKFDQAGVPWNYFLSKIKFHAVTQTNGSVIVKVSSKEPLTEPFLDFLLEVAWPEGSQFREFTVLVDPPAAYQPPSLPTFTPPNDRLEQLAESADTDTPRPVRKSTPKKKRQPKVQTVSHIDSQTPSSGEYGPTRTSENLWLIAKKLSKDSAVPSQQLMTALYQANPDAFQRGDMNALKTGVVLRIPDTTALTGKTDKDQKKSTQNPSTKIAEDKKALELVAPVESKITDKTEISGQTQVGPDGGENAAQPAGQGTGDAKMDANQLTLQTRIEKLEQQLTMMQELLALKDQQLATLQNSEKTPSQPGNITPQQPDVSATTQTTEPVSPPPATTPEAEKVSAPATPTPEAKPAMAPEQPKPATPPPAPPAPPVVEQADFFSSSPYYWTVGGLSTGILGLLGWLLWRKRRMERMINDDSMFAAASQIKMPDTDSNLNIPVMDISSTTSYDVGTVGESSFISDFTPSDFEAFDSEQSDIDPMSEADVYLAYGRYQQAEDLIRNAIADQPNKDDYKLKLLEIFYANENKEAFAAYAQNLLDTGKADDRVFWNKVTEMGKELIPNSALFGGNIPAASPSPQTAPLTADAFQASLDNSDSIESIFDAEPSAENLFDKADKDNGTEFAEFDTLADDNALDFDLSTFSSTEKPSASQNVSTNESQSAEAEIESIDFDFNDFELTPPAQPEPTKPKQDDIESFDFNFELASVPESDSSTADQATTDADDTLDMAKLETIEFTSFAEAPVKNDDRPAIKETKAASSSELTPDLADDFNFDFDFEVPSGPGEQASNGEDMDFGVSDLTDMDEFETKIDLAKAYIDMGDTAAAKVIAQEVLVKGKPEQQQAAQALLDELK